MHLLKFDPHILYYMWFYFLGKLFEILHKIKYRSLCIQLANLLQKGKTTETRYQNHEHNRTQGACLNHMIQHLLFCVQSLSHNLIFMRFMFIIAYNIRFCILLAVYIICISHHLFIYFIFLINTFKFGTIMNIVAINIFVYAFVVLK